jgi:hypothetical protein
MGTAEVLTVIVGMKVEEKIDNSESMNSRGKESSATFRKRNDSPQ